MAKRKKNYSLSNRSLLRLRGVNPVLIEIIKEAIKKSPYDFGIPKEGGYRSEQEQYQLYLKGVSKCDGYRKKSYHQSGNAFDIYIWNGETGKAEWDKDKLEAVARHILEVAKEKFDVLLEWGGDWERFYDGCHFQV